MTIGESQRYGGSMKEAEDSRRWHRFCSQVGLLRIRHGKRCVLLSLEPVSAISPAPPAGEQKEAI